MAKQYTDAEKKHLISKFGGIFRGNEGMYIKHQAPFIREGRKVKSATFIGFAKDGDEFLPVTWKTYKEHLEGKDGLALVPILNYDVGEVRYWNVCFFSVIDIDFYGYPFSDIVKCLYTWGLKFTAFLSKSGGLHLYFFYKDATEAARAVPLMQRVIDTFGLDKLFDGHVEIFPKQVILVEGKDRGNAVLLPFYGTFKSDEGRMLAEDGNLYHLRKAMDHIERMMTTVEEMEAVLDSLPYRDAPFCVQMILLSGALKEDDGRNNFLFSAAVYLKKKAVNDHGEDFRGELEAMNAMLEAPLESKEVEKIYESVSKREWGYKCRDIPCKDYCNREKCAGREYSPCKKKHRHFTGAEYWGEISEVMAEEPYYEWEVKPEGAAEAKSIRVDSVDDLYSQSAVQKSCLRYLHWSPYRVGDNDWIKAINTAMKGIEERKISVKPGTDTTDLSELRDLFFRYLTRRLFNGKHKYMIPMGQVYYEDGVYYFSHTSFKEYLRIMKFSLGKTNLRAKLLDYGCLEAVLEDEVKEGETLTIPCWKREEDDILKKRRLYFQFVLEKDAEVLAESAREGPPEKEKDEREEWDEDYGGDVKYGDDRDIDEDDII
jgi:hypothetical protein